MESITAHMLNKQWQTADKEGGPLHFRIGVRLTAPHLTGPAQCIVDQL